MVDEYDVTFAVKEWLLKNGWRVVVFNPPGAQGTFTIPNPEKDPSYRGQTGSLAPDIVAIKDRDKMLLIESKPKFAKADITKVQKLLEDPVRQDLIRRLVEAICSANDIGFSREKLKIRYAKAHGPPARGSDSVDTFLVETVAEWNSSRLRPPIRASTVFRVTYFPSRTDAA